jgi:hypothetical protein
MKQSDRNYVVIWLAILSTTGLGCRSLQSNQAQLISQVAASPAGPLLPLHSATLVYRILPASGHMEVSPASLTMPADAVQPPEPAMRSVQLLVIRYPNPSGKRDSALAELVVTEPVLPGSQRNSRWHNRWSGWLRESLPGIGWSEGVQEAKALTIPVRDLRSLLRSCQGNRDIQRASHEVSDTEAMLLVEVNGQSVVQPRRRSLELDALLYNIRHHGRLVSCLVGSGAELAEMARGTDAALLTALGSGRDHLLVRLPPAVISN